MASKSISVIHITDTPQTGMQRAHDPSYGDALAPATPPASVPSTQNAAAVYLFGLSNGSRPAHKNALTEFAAFISKGKLLPEAFPWGVVRYEHVSVYRAQLLKDGAPTTARRKLSAIRGVLRTAYRLNQIEHAEYSKAIEQDRIEGSSKPVGEYISAEVIGKLYAAAKNSPRDMAVVALLADCALRRVDAVRAKAEDYHSDTAELTVLGKRKKWRTLSLTPYAKGIIDKWLMVRGREPGPLLLRLSKWGKPTKAALSVKGITHIIAAIASRAGVTVKPHDLRRTYITDALLNDVDTLALASQVGHDDPKTTKKYDLREKQARDKVAAAIPKRE